MTDPEMTKLCAEAMGFEVHLESHPTNPPVAMGYVFLKNRKFAGVYDPLHNDAQAMALVKKFDLQISRYYDPSYEPEVRCKMLRVHPQGTEMWSWPATGDVDGCLNRAICECVAKMQKGKT